MYLPQEDIQYIRILRKTITPAINYFVIYKSNNADKNHI